MSTGHTALLAELRSEDTKWQEGDPLYLSLRRRAADVIETLARRVVRSPDRPRDHACARCVGVDGEIVKPGFVCSYHIAEDLLSDDQENSRG